MIMFYNKLLVLLLINFCNCNYIKTRSCESLLMGQYKCSSPEIDEKTQQPVNCSINGIAKVPCFPAPNVTCGNYRFNGDEIGFFKNITCKWTQNCNYKTTLLLSVFLGFFGIDRFYLGYAAIGLLKLCTFGFMLFGYVIDLILILTQTLEPADGSAYIVDYYDQIIHSSWSYTNNTFNVTYI
jgi:TM2 domain-containing membrane protein YozV